MAVYAPIYKDTIYAYEGEELDYRIESPRGITILEGVVSVKPDGTPAQIYMNRLCEPFLAQEINPLVPGVTPQPACKSFYLFNNLNDALLETYHFLRMYSGDWNGEDRILSDPIKPGVSTDMTLPFSIYSANGVGLPMPSSGGGGGGGEEQGCGYYIYFNNQSGSTCDITVTSALQTLTLDVHTNIPYQTFPMGTLIHTHTPTGVIAAYENPDLLLLEYEDYYNSNKGHHTVYDHTNEIPPTIQYKVLENYQGKTKHYVENFYVEPPLCNTRTLIYTLNITQLP